MNFVIVQFIFDHPTDFGIHFKIRYFIITHLY